MKQEAYKETPETTESQVVEAVISKKEKVSSWGKFKEAYNALVEKYQQFFSFEQKAIETISAEVETEEAKAEVEKLNEAAQETVEDTFRKISEQLGSNEGGWYENTETGEHWYLKFYKNPDQARVEFIANAVYEKLGIKVPKSELIEVEGKLAFASKEVPNVQGIYREEQQASPDIRNGFVADAYLANWDVVGLNYDNIVKDADGMYRIDNGGSLVFRAQGANKEYTVDAIPELESMLDPEFPAGKVFAGITEKEMQSQARHLIEHLNEQAIDHIIDESGLQGEFAEKISAGLKGRRQFLNKKFISSEIEGERPPLQRGRLIKVIDRFLEQRESSKELGIRPRIGILVDAEKIENQQVDIIDANDLEEYQLNFKLTSQHWFSTMDRYIDVLSREPKPEWSDKIRRGSIQYQGGAARHELVEGWELRTDGIVVKISTGLNKNRNEVGVALGLVQIEIPKGEGTSLQEEVEAKIGTIFRDFLGIEGGLAMPEREEEKIYKERRYEWHHKLEEVPVGVEERLAREEVFPSYFTFVEKGKHKEYEAISPYAVFHTIQNLELIPTIIKSGGLLSTHERYRRGLLMNGMSSLEDLATGGADSVFTRIVTEEGLNHQNIELSEKTLYNPVFVVDKDLLDRTDWYAYSDDRYGSTAPNVFEQRRSPEEFFRTQKELGFRWGNEQMFRLGIPMEKMRIVCLEDQRDQLLAQLRAAGVERVGERSLEEFVVGASDMYDLIDISRGQEPRSIRRRRERMSE